ncbi:MAG: hypothetical protein HYX32_04770 [Actinobacteria bacterium]|nr:hypothetical protein [Actinomycetota bacterium]
MKASPTATPALPLPVIRRIAVILGAIGIAGIIAGSIANNTGLAITSGLVSAIAIGFLILLTAAVGRDAFERKVADRDDARSPRFDEHIARDVEARIDQLVADGADEAAVRQLVTRAIDLGREST